MTADLDHYKLAEFCLERAQEAEEYDGPKERYFLAQAQVHATLALVDATGYLAGRTGGE